ncbi:hypothetical protein [Zhouia amylolytica]|uniref:Thioredoxin domain-containing protein n=1 Tax=Zhouia amylolytica AD3 TaxID=1286632 RepID=W2USU4_9FLAO|nr:hypothetical protein [Zhouia amylolytica]ETN96382.1 hypothetical protein P278_07260 [Zhouia amylolytica AD3]
MNIHKSKYYLGLLLIIFFLLGHSYVQRTKNKRNIDNLNKLNERLLTDSNRNLENSVSERILIRQIEIINESNDININLPMEAENGKKVILGNMLNKGDLVFVFTRFNFCQPCIDIQMRLIDEMLRKYENFKITIVANGYDAKSLKIFKSTRNINFEILRAMENPLILENNDKNLPYYFYVDDNFRKRNLFIPTKESIQLTQLYLNKSS